MTLIKADWSDVIYDVRVRDWCKMPYPDHPHGCPNYDKKDICPPKVCMVDEYFDTDKPVGFVVTEFDLGAHVQKMLEKHPEWTMRQARCVLYWQSRARKVLKEATDEALSTSEFDLASYCPEAMGVNLFRTMRNVGVTLKKNPTSIVYKINMVGHSPNKRDVEDYF